MKEFIKAIRLTLVFWLLTGILYPLLILGIAQSIFPITANGSIMLNINDQPIGSTLIGQGFTTERYFQSRPSAVKYSQGQKAQPYGISGATNLAPGNLQLINRVKEDFEKLKEDNKKPLAELIYASGSGLDPHISLKAIREQLPRVLQARGIKEDDVIPLIKQYTDGRFLGIFGEPGVNILRLNYALDLQDINRRANN
ncbi:K(+)-transporting ATPase subunit C [Anabaena sp. FACHB-1237]|uniref:K(+)-transporting ATPase subunit C n=1 Tax=Anabaena sp. FACHB-1237 TaxID=2692769 RepID=UPI0016800747|nr:K(+)-transporting ATPase subunit C [Anabaena sp. FACHB-1237]MBD2137859.1 K(+)-transporting ATPase subunit C [Anabaena sp. FACHB-1237]